VRTFVDVSRKAEYAKPPNWRAVQQVHAASRQLSLSQHVCSVTQGLDSFATTLLIEGRTVALALFNLAIDSKLRGCDVVALRVEHIAPNCYAVDSAIVRKDRKTSQIRADGHGGNILERTRVQGAR